MIYIAGDKHGFKTMDIVERYLKTHGIRFENLGVKSTSEKMKLENMIPKVTKRVLKDPKNKGILSCGTGVGIEVGANKFSGIRACLATDEKVAEWSRVYDNCNVLCLVGWNANKKSINKILDAWLRAEYDGSKNRSKMFKEFDKWH